MALETEPKNAGRRIITQAEAEAIAAKARPDSQPTRKNKRGVNRREALTYAGAAAGALLLATGAATLAQPDPNTDEFFGSITPEFLRPYIPGGFAFPRFQEGEFGGTFTLSRTVDEYSDTEAPDLNPAGKFYVVKVAQGQGVEDAAGAIPADNQQQMQAIYQVCTHLGCLIPFQSAEDRFICPCHGSTFERNSQYVRGPATRNLDQFSIEIQEGGVIVVNTGDRLSGAAV